MTFSSLTNITEKQACTLLDKVNETSDLSDFIRPQTRITAEDLSFYPDTQYCLIEDDSSVPVKTLSCLYRAKPVECRISGQSQDWVMEMNTVFGLVLNEDNIAAYVRFLLDHTPLKGGKMMYLQTIEDMPWRDEPVMEVRNTLSGLLTPFLVEENPAVNGFRCAFSALYAESLFTIQADLDQNGRITLLNEEEIASDLPVFSKAYAV